MTETLLTEPIESSGNSSGELPLIQSIDILNSKAEHLLGESTVMRFEGAIEYEQSASNGEVGVDQSLIGIVSLGEGSAVGLLRVKYDGKTVLGLSKLEKNTGATGERATLLGVIEPGQDFNVGRNDLDDSDKAISRQHFNVSLSDSDELKITDTSLNGIDLLRFTAIDDVTKDIGPGGLRRFLSKKNHEDQDNTLELADYVSAINGWAVKSKILADTLSPEVEAEWDYTVGPEKMKQLGRKLKGYEEPYVSGDGLKMPAKYLGRDVISRDSGINGGVYIVPGIQEAIVVDDANSQTSRSEGWSPTNQMYEQANNDFLRRARGKGVSIEHTVKQGQEEEVLEAALESAMEKLKYSLQTSKEMESQFSDKKINLDILLDEGKGVCRHQALLVGYYLERAINGGFMKGNVSVDRNYIKNKGGHAWTRFTSSEGKVYIIDPAQEFVGTLDDAKKTASWDYRRPEDV